MLEATIRVQGHDSKLWHGRISNLPKSAAADIPIQLSTKAGGPIAVKPQSKENQLIPQNQVFLVGIDFIDADDSIAINSVAQVKIHNEHRSCCLVDLPHRLRDARSGAVEGVIFRRLRLSACMAPCER